VIGQSRSTQRRIRRVPDDEPRLVKRIVWLACEYGRYGFRRITRLTSEDVLERLSDLFVHRGVPEHIRSDNGSEFTAKCVREWLGRVGVKTLYIEPGSPWENGYVESFNGKLRDELLERESFDTLLEAKVLVERWRQDYNTIRPHSSLGYHPLAPEARHFKKFDQISG
jgi:transposase InsO family protein